MFSFSRKGFLLNSSKLGTVAPTYNPRCTGAETRGLALNVQPRLVIVIAMQKWQADHPFTKKKGHQFKALESFL